MNEEGATAAHYGLRFLAVRMDEKKVVSSSVSRRSTCFPKVWATPFFGKAVSSRMIRIAKFVVRSRKSSKPLDLAM
jgi:hypothetical protein